MKRIIILILSITLFILTSFTQTQPRKTIVKNPQPQKIEKITTQEAITSNGKKVLLKSDKTWDFVKEEATLETNIIKRTPSEMPLDISITKIPKDFKGHDFDFLYEVIKGNKSFKSEFETTDVYQAKVADSKALSLNSQFAFFCRQYQPYDDDTLAFYKFSYNADEELFTITLTERKFIKCRSKDSYYQGETFFVSNDEILKKPFTLNVKAYLAKIIKDEAILLLLFKPSKTSQSETEFQTKLIFGKIDNIWLVNEKTGEVYAKFMK